MDKRTFLKQFSLAAFAMDPLMKTLAASFEEVEHIPATALAQDGDFWLGIRSHYNLKDDYINLENGYFCMMPDETLGRYLAHVRNVNLEASYYMRTVQEENNYIMRKKLAELAGCSVDELIITRNTTESLDLVIGGIHWKKGDEVIMADQDYGAMLNMFRLMGERYGVVSKSISLPNHPINDAEIIKLYSDQITDKTRLIMLCHVVNINGQVLPVKKICEMAHSKGVEVMVDGAHAFAHLNVKPAELDCDYYGTSLHKWLSTPMGAGMLYVKKNKIKNLWPLMAENVKDENDILRLNHTGTKPVHIDLGIADAIEYHNIIGAERKEARLKYLKNYWSSQFVNDPKVIINTPHELERSCAIANVRVEGMTAKAMAKTLLEEYNIWTVAINRPNVHGCRITPNVYTTIEELDQFVAALKDMASKV
ncbi:MAG: aminotransferase class V-fold PLP-dependent enzyme [Crocinitomicaceae bacterium]|nr:aminotransferase class V-fold PLP-dependent enzyme [Crocinitomicaceae bacterium]